MSREGSAQERKAAGSPGDAANQGGVTLNAEAQGMVNVAGDVIGRDHNELSGDFRGATIYINSPGAGGEAVADAPPERPRLPYEPEMVEMAAATVKLGDDTPERPRHEVALDAYQIGRTLITNAQYAEFLKQNPAMEPPARSGWFLRQPPKDALDDAIRGVSWNDAQQYCLWLQSMTERAYQLPSEAQWEHAAKRQKIEWGDAQEWCNTRWGASRKKPQFVYPYQAHDGREDSTIQQGRSYRVVRGLTQPAERRGASADGASLKRGFRMVIAAS